MESLEIGIFRDFGMTKEKCSMSEFEEEDSIKEEV